MSALPGPGWYYCCAAVAQPLQLVPTLPCCEWGEGGRGDGREDRYLTYNHNYIITDTSVKHGRVYTARGPQPLTSLTTPDQSPVLARERVCGAH